MPIREVVYYESLNGQSPFLEWMNQLEIYVQIKIDRLIQRASQGGAIKSIKSLKAGLYELKIPHGPGLR